MTLRRRLEALNTRFNALVQNRLRNEDEDNNLSTQHNTIDRLRMFQSNIPNEVSATTRRRAARQSIIRISFIENSGEHLITTQRTTVKKLVVPFSMDERAFHQKIREAFPIIGEGEIEICRVDRRRRVIPVELSSVCPAAIKACPEFGRSAVYVRLKNTSSSAGTQHESSNEVNCQSSATNTSSSAGTQHESSTTDPICGTVEIAANPGTSSRDHQRHQFESLEQRRRQKIAERRARVCQIVEPEQGIAIQFQYPDGTRKTRKFVESQPIQDLFAFAGSDDMASEVFRVQLSWSSNTILSTVDGSLLDHEISRPSTLYVLWMSGVQIEGLIASSVESSTDQPAASPDLGSIPSPIHSSDQDVGYSNTVAGNIPSPIHSSDQDVDFSPCPVPAFSPPIDNYSTFMQLHTGSSPSTPPCEVYALDSEDEEDVVMLTSPVYSNNEIDDDVTAADIIRTFQRENLNLEERVIVVARRRKILHSACTALKTSYFAWHKSPQIEFVGESADDYGGPSREFFRLLMQEVQSSFGIFEGKTGQMFFNYDQVAVEMKRYYTAGKLIAWSLMHGGSGFKALDSTLFKLMCGQADSAEEFDWHNLPDGEIQDKVRQVFFCQTQEDVDGIVSSLGDWIADCGVPGIYNAAPKDMRRIYGQVIKHYIYFRTADMIAQFKDGMNSCGNLWQIVERNWKVFLPLFTNEQKELARDEFRALFKICWSEEGSNLREREEDTIFCWELLLNSIQEKQSTITFKEMLVFITGADSIPPLGFPGEPRIEFYTQENRRLPFASTCGMVLFLPRGIQEEEELTDLLNTALKGYLGFGKI